MQVTTSSCPVSITSRQLQEDQIQVGSSMRLAAYAERVESIRRKGIANYSAHRTYCYSPLCWAVHWIYLGSCRSLSPREQLCANVVWTRLNKNAIRCRN